MAARKKVMTILGTRPEIIRLAAVMKRLDRHVEHKIVHTGQNYDYELNEVFFKDLEVRRPDYFLNVNTSSLGQVYGNILIAVEPILKSERPDAVLILGDTNSSIAGIIVRRMKIPLYHMEAGNRCFDFNVPEEMNRRIIDHISDFNLVYTEHARRHLIAEGFPQRRIYLTGSPMREVLADNMDKIHSSGILEELGLTKGGFFVVSAHREENVDNRENLTNILAAMEKLHEEFRLPVIVSTHPRTRKRLDSLGAINISDGIRFLKPFGFNDYNWLQMNARCVISDSGTIAEESAILDFPAITIRNAIERPEALDAGTLIMTGLNPDTIVAAVRLQTSEDNARMPRRIPADYEIANTSYRVVKFILGTAGVSHLWEGIRPNTLS
ncbi:MAG TPA: UDP-N-acetylglucosamine 2-epimerase (non-hydrolyzing) [Sedimentisphaerales bacterium]|nr:UDP-N-acetylglucosamine 2-epimerase (non-hydrolyzing) [Sedimentisphaerales bacterium]